MQYLDAVSKMAEWSLVCFQDKPFNITVIQGYIPINHAEEAEAEQFYEDLQDLLELTPKKDVSIHSRAKRGTWYKWPQEGETSDLLK